MTNWLDFSGAPPLLIPTRLVPYWRGAINPATGAYSDLSSDIFLTDYDRACAAAWPGRGVLPVADSSALVLYSEYDEHTWLESLGLVACGGWVPTEVELTGAAWADPVSWEIQDSEFLLMNSAADGAAGLRENDFVAVELLPGKYIIEYAHVESTYAGCFHRFFQVADWQRAA